MVVVEIYCNINNYAFLFMSPLCRFNDQYMSLSWYQYIHWLTLRSKISLSIINTHNITTTATTTTTTTTTTATTTHNNEHNVSGPQ